MLIYGDVSKNFHVAFNFSFFFFFALLVCQVSSQSIAVFFPGKMYGGSNFTPTPCQRLQSQNKSVGIGLIGLTESSDTLNYKSVLNIAFYKLFYTYCYCLYLCGTKYFVLKA